jgi:hypothetical protein
MKSKKYKLERKVLEEVNSSLYSYHIRAKLLSAFVAENYLEDNYYHVLLRKYFDTLGSYTIELSNLLSENKAFFLVSAEFVEKLNNYKTILTSIEDAVNSSNVFSLKVH